MWGGGGGAAININLGEQFLKGTNNRAKIVLVRIFVYTACVDSMEIVFKYWQHLFALSTSLLPQKNLHLSLHLSLLPLLACTYLNNA